ncbi:DUF2855 family protein [soil metagenome]
MTLTTLEFIVNKEQLRECKFAPISVPSIADLPDGQVVMKVDKFAFTSNNVTYAAFGTPMKYWDFFPTAQGWGNIPVWGFGEVMLSKAPGVEVGERFYGYFPMASHVCVTPLRVSDAGFVDGAAHRQAMHGLYNQYVRTSTDPAYTAESEDEQVLLRPLFITSFMIDDFLDDNAYFDADTILISSASSKTSYGLAFMLSMRKRTASTAQKCRVIGLTSAGNKAFVDSLGIYDDVITYDQVNTLPATQAVVYVDMAGSAPLRSSLHHHFKDNMKYSCAVGGTHWDELGGGAHLPGARPVLFFAPAQIKKRATDWGPGGVQTRLAQAWHQFMQPVMGLPEAGNTEGKNTTESAWMQVIHGSGTKEVQSVYLSMLDGGAAPTEGHVLSLSS